MDGPKSDRLDLLERQESLPLEPDVATDGPGERVRWILKQDTTDGSEPAAKRELFTELSELGRDEENEPVWKESARWVKYEESVEWGGDKWSKPHVATLSLHSLFELRSCLMHAMTLFDLEVEYIEDITDVALDQLIDEGKLTEDQRLPLRQTLMSRHEHQYQSVKAKQRRGSVIDELVNTHITRGGGQIACLRPVFSPAHQPNQGKTERGQVPTRRMSRFGSRPSTTSLGLGYEDEHDTRFLRKLAPGTEASNVLIGKVDFLEEPLMVFVRLRNSKLLSGLTEVPVPTRFVTILLGPKGETERYHEIGRSVATLMSDPVFHSVAYKATKVQDLLAGLDEFLDQVVVLPPGEWDPSIRLPPPQSPRKMDERLAVNAMAPMPSKEKAKKSTTSSDEPNLQHAGLKRTGRLFGGLIGDIKRRRPFYFPSDFKDALNLQSFASVIFIYFACIAPTITFGGLLGDKTKGYISTMEMILASAICGCVYSLTSGQPLTILGATGPMLVFEEIVFSFSEDNDIEYMSFRVWIGLWTTVFCIVLVATDVSALIGMFTRFTEETFAILISFIFIYEAIEKIHKVEKKYPPLGDFYSNQTLMANCSCMSDGSSVGLMPSQLTLAQCKSDMYNGTASGAGCPKLGHEGDVFFLSLIEFLATFGIAYMLKKMRTTRYFPTKVRSIISDFAVIIAIICVFIIDLAYNINTPKLSVPENFEPTRSKDRDWFINPVPSDLKAWVPFAAILPAILVVILVFMDQQITALIVNRRENKLKKGPGYHLDLLIVGILIGVCSLFGLPWVVAATVRSVSHVNSLHVLDEHTAPGEKPKLLGTREQRVTNFMVFLLHGFSVLMTPILNKMPLPILYGLFLYMGVASLRGVQFFERVMLMFMPPKYMPDLHYVRHVPNRRMHLFTLLQLASLGVLCIVKLTPAKLIFPIAVLGLVVVRYFLKYVFTEQELEILDDKMPELSRRKKEDEKKEEEQARGTYNERMYKRPGATGEEAVPERYRPLNMTSALDRSDTWRSASFRLRHRGSQSSDGTQTTTTETLPPPTSGGLNGRATTLTEAVEEETALDATTTGTDAVKV